ncbi:hypothetical protein F1559_005063 [Cyanidiococcus yangmingshanensis]|uniref:very-long-chain (3R)-3-hydroxyacyl-CoA dehydratase n=1 Tax=Cyanidiococcus yangmingshanensis TaxID=2690220 RepID=A0A7J7INI1_9RHOD|nr:hypothetical protein F1559_005063 [Cyanidiococcus yangmingshanensis]
MSVKTWLFLYNAALFGGWTWIFMELMVQVGRFWKELCFSGPAGNNLGSLLRLPVVQCSSYVLLGWWSPPPLKVLLGFGDSNWQRFEAHLLGSTLKLLLVFQTVTVLELVHALLGWVRASPSTTALQICSRLFVLWFTIARFASSIAQTANSGYLALLSAWSATEVVRYAYFTVLSYGSMASGGLLSVHELVPTWLTWLRYSMFLVLYPIGVSAEIWSVLRALPLIRETNFLQINMPNRWNFAFDFSLFCSIALLGYIPGLPFLYSHMLKQRTRHLNAASRRSNQKRASSPIAKPSSPKQKAS